MRAATMRIGRWILPLALAGLWVAASLPALAQQPSEQALVVSGPAPELFLLYTGDVIGYLDPCG